MDVMSCNVMQWMWCDAMDVMCRYGCDAMHAMNVMCDAMDVMQWMRCDRCDTVDVMRCNVMRSHVWCDGCDARLCYGSITSHITFIAMHASIVSIAWYRIASHHIHHITSISSHHIHRITPLTLLVNLLTCHVHFYYMFLYFYVIWWKGIIIH